MAASDDLNRLAAQDVVYLSKYVWGGANSSAKEVFRGRLRQAIGYSTHPRVRTVWLASISVEWGRVGVQARAPLLASR
jgi:hypothetical protein